MDLGDESDPHPLWRRYMVFGGSTLSQCSETSPDEEYLTKGFIHLRFATEFLKEKRYRSRSLLRQMPAAL
jgi:hypothetical protein